MKIHRSAYILMAASILAGTAGCSKTENVLNSQIDPLAFNAAPESVTFDWQEAYEKQLSEFKKSDKYSEDSRFDLRDITNDNIPELIISPSSDSSTRCDIYFALGSSVDILTSCGACGEFDFIPSILFIGYHYEGDGFTVGEYQKFSEGFYNSEVSYYTNVGSASAGAAIRYEINGNSVSLAEYEETVAAYQNEQSYMLGRKYTFGDDAINYAIHCSESWSKVLTGDQKLKYRESVSQYIDTGTYPNAAFEIADLDMNGLPEVVISTGTDDEEATRILYLDEEGVQTLNVSNDYDGCIRFDISKEVFYSGSEKRRCWSLAEGDVNGFKPSDSIMVCGRKYELNKNNVDLAFS